MKFRLTYRIYDEFTGKYIKEDIVRTVRAKSAEEAKKQVYKHTSFYYSPALRSGFRASGKSVDDTNPFRVEEVI